MQLIFPISLLINPYFSLYIHLHLLFFQSNEPLDRHIAFGSFHNNNNNNHVVPLWYSVAVVRFQPGFSEQWSNNHTVCCCCFLYFEFAKTKRTELSSDKGANDERHNHYAQHSLTETLRVCKSPLDPSMSWQIFGLRARYPSLVRSANVSETRDVSFRRRRPQNGPYAELHTLASLGQLEGLGSRPWTW